MDRRGRGTRKEDTAPKRAKTADVREHEPVAEALRTDDAKLLAILDASPDIMCRVRRDGTLLDIRGNVALREPSEVSIGRSVTDWNAPEDREAVLQVIQQALQTGTVQTFETKLAGAEGVRYFESRVVPWAADEVISSVRDVTERRRVEEELRYERDFTCAVLDTVGALVIVLDAQGRIVRSNHAAERTTGYTSDEMKGRFIWEVLSLPGDHAAAQRFFEEVDVTRLPGELQAYCRTKQGDQRLVAWSHTVITDAQGMSYIIRTGIDITERRRAEEEGRRRQSELAHLARLTT